MLCASSALHAFYAHPRLNPRAESETGDHFDVGTAAHALLLEGRDTMVVIDAPDWRTKAAKEQRDAARARWPDAAPRARRPGRRRDGRRAARSPAPADRRRRADVHRRRTPSRRSSGVRMTSGAARAFDWLRTDRSAIDDYKTTGVSANPEVWARTMFNAGHDLQAAWYLRGLRAITGDPLDDPAAFRFAVQETTAPYALSVIALNPDAMCPRREKVSLRARTIPRGVGHG